MSHLFISRTLALAALALSAFPAHAATVPDPVSGDVFLAFRASGGDGEADEEKDKDGENPQ